MKVKICGLRTIADVALINELKPDLAGFVLAPGSHTLTPEQAKLLRSKLRPDIASVGVFVNETVAKVAAIGNELHLDFLQLHGDEDATYVQELRKLTQIPLIKAIRLGEKFAQGTEGVNILLQSLTQAGVHGFLFDTLVPGAYGGTGKTFNLKLLEELKITLPFFLAGGLNAENVQAIISKVEHGKQGKLFQGVDVSGSVETEKQKDRSKVKAFLAAVRMKQKIYLQAKPKARKDGRK
jgi:phosphoribosylanthranilate isomerase